MSLSISVTKDVTSLSVSDTSTSINITPQTTTIGVANVAITQASVASSIGYTPSGHLSAQTVQTALDEIAASPEFTAALKSKLDAIEAQADVTDTENVVDALIAGNAVSIASDGTISADVLSEISAGDGINISEDGVISVADIAIATVQTAANETEHLALTTQQGDVVIRTDENKSYIHNGGTTGTMADFTELATNTNGVLSINGATGAVTFGKANLDGYVANEFIDWTVTQTENIHADNYINTTYSAGDNITIDENNVISSTGGSGGVSFTAVGNLTLNDQNQLDTIGNPIFESVKFKAADGTDSGVYIKDFPNENYPTGAFGDGLGVYYQSGDDPEQLIAALLEDQLATFGTFNAFSGLEVHSVAFAFSISGWENRQGANTAQTRVPESVHNYTTGISTNHGTGESEDLRQYNANRHDLWLTPETSIYMTEQEEIDTDSINQTGGGIYNIANKKFVEDKITELDDTLGNIRIPEVPNTYHYLMSYNGAYTWARPLMSVQFVYDQNDPDDDIQLAVINGLTGEIGYGMHILQGTGITFDKVGSTQLTINATTDGLPEQSASTNGYVLTSVNETSTWQSLGDASLPTQTDNSGKFLTTNGTTASWADVDTYPSQTGNADKFLTTNGTEVSWADVDALPDRDETTSGKFLSDSGTNVYWADVPSAIPEQTSNTGKYLTTNGSQLSWANINTAGTTGDISFSNNTISAGNNDTVNVDDNLDVDGTVTGEEFQANGAGSPTIESLSTFNINAPDGFFVNNVRMDESFFVGYVDFTSFDVESTDFSNVSFYSNSEADKRIIQIPYPNLSPTAHFVECEYMNPYTGLSIDFDEGEIEHNILTTVTIRTGNIYVRLRDYNLPSSKSFGGTLKIKIYAR